MRDARSSGGTAGPEIVAAGIDGAAGVDRALHALAVMGTATPPQYVQATGRPAAELDACVDRGLAMCRPPSGRYGLTPAGRERHARWLPAATASLRGLLPVVLDAFRLVNRDVKECCTRWQLRDGVPNPHDDAGYDSRIIEELAPLAVRCAQLLAPLAVVEERFARYPARLDGALARARAGEARAVTGVLCGSFHEVWMELHRDLLLSGGAERCAADE
ncbi:hypothetical protein [Frankia sp. CiP3]|uniref:hypothetical protein n=1 Tax=Frankia sp. CiP3 TaxID=2880971 RepID=UPI001EF5C3A9|nr:hypothetical protein [Frankia sp. CiP3]